MIKTQASNVGNSRRSSRASASSPRRPGESAEAIPDDVVIGARLLRLLAAMTFGTGLLSMALRDSIEKAVLRRNPNFGPGDVEGVVGSAAVFAMVFGAVFAAICLVAARMLLRRTRHARPFASGLLVLVAVFAFVLLVGVTITRELPFVFVPLMGAGAILALAVLVLLWRRQSTEFFRAGRGER